jgi:hypothetical protein
MLSIAQVASFDLKAELKVANVYASTPDSASRFDRLDSINHAGKLLRLRSTFRHANRYEPSWGRGIRCEV